MGVSARLLPVLDCSIATIVVLGQVLLVARALATGGKSGRDGCDAVAAMLLQLWILFLYIASE